MKKNNFFITILTLSVMVMSMSLSSCYSLLGGYYIPRSYEYTRGYVPIPVGEDAYITPGKSAEVEYGISLEAAKRKLPKNVVIRQVLGQYRDDRGFIGWIFVCYEADRGEIHEYTVTQAGYVRK